MICSSGECRSPVEKEVDSALIFWAKNDTLAQGMMKEGFLEVMISNDKAYGKVPQHGVWLLRRDNDISPAL